MKQNWIDWSQAPFGTEFWIRSPGCRGRWGRQPREGEHEFYIGISRFLGDSPDFVPDDPKGVHATVGTQPPWWKRLWWDIKP